MSVDQSDARVESSTLFRGVRVFDGRSATLSELTDVAVTGSVITGVGHQEAPAGPATTVIEGRGGVLMPGLIDAHAHAVFATLSPQAALTADPGYLAVRGSSAARDMLMQGFTTVRDVGGPVFGIKRAIDEGLVAGPRIYPSGAFISQTSGHGDFRLPYEVPRGSCGRLSHIELLGGAVIADGVDEVLRGVREQLMQGASQIKMMAGGGVSSAYDPIDVTEYTEAESRAGVDAAENWGTYVCVHAYTDRAVQQSIRAGVRCVEHGQLLAEETVVMMAEHGAWWSLQPFLDDQDAIPLADPRARAKQLQVTAGTDRAYELAAKHHLKVAWGTDTLFDARLAARQGAQLAKMSRWLSPAEVLASATSVNAELLAMSGERNPYPGTLGVIEVGALADVILVDGNPLTDLDLIATPETSFLFIMKNGVIHKNTRG